jgi:hypothetical protein
MVEKKKCPCENTFNSRGGFEELQEKIAKTKTKKPFPTFEDVEKADKLKPAYKSVKTKTRQLFPTFEDAEKEAKQVPAKVWDVK